MGVTVELQGEGNWSLPLLPDTPRSVLDDIKVKDHAYAKVVFVPGDFSDGDLSTADLLALSRFTGLYYGQTDGLLNLEGPGLRRLLGDSSDAGNMYAGVDTTSANLNFADQLDGRVFTSFSNGLTRGATNAVATLRTMKIPGGITRMNVMESTCAIYGDFEDRINPDGSVDFDTIANLYVTTPTVILTAEGGRDGNLDGLHANLEVDTIDVEDARSRIEARWNETTPGTNNGVATNTFPATWVDFAGAAIDHVSVVDYSPKRPFRENPNIKPRQNAIRYGAYYVNALAQATNMATALANKTGSYAYEVTADIDEFDPWRFIQVGDYAYVYDLDLDIADTGNEVYYRGSAVHPDKLRLHAMTTPIQEGYGAWIVRSDGAGGFLDPYRLTPYIDFEDGVTTLELGTTRRFHPRNARPKRFNRKRLRRQQILLYKLNQFVEAYS